MGCNGWRSGTSISRPSARRSGRKDAPTVLLPSSAARSCRWPGRRRSSCSPAPSAKGGEQGGEIRTVSASFRASPGFPLRFREGYCSCARGTNCVHVAALVLAATDETLLPATTAAGITARRSALPWEQSLDSLLAAPQAPGTPAASDDHRERAARGRAVPGAEHDRSLSATPATPRTTGATSRPPRTPSASSSSRPGWCSRGASAAGSPATCPGPGSTTCCCAMSSRAAHVRLLHELYALYRASSPPSTLATTTRYASPGYGDQKYLDLSACESRQLWPVLEQAHAVGLPFVYRGKQGTVPPPGTAELCLDVTTDGTTLLIAPVIKTTDGADAVPLRFIGTEGHGVVYADRGAGVGHGELARFRLARLTHPVPAQLQHLALADERLVIPEAGQAAFLSRYYPRLRRQATVTSSDGSFTAPEISGPALVVRAAYARGHHVDIRWEWSYQVGGTELRAALGAARDPFRDPEAEARVLAGLSLPAGAPGVPREATVRGLPAAFRPHRPASGPRAQAGPGGHPPRPRRHDVHHRGAAAAAGPRRRAGRDERAGAGLPGGRRLAGDRPVHRRARRRARLVRPGHHGHGRGPRGAVRRPLRGARARPVAPAAPRRGVLLPGQAGARRARPAHRRGPRAAGPAGRRPADQPVSGGPVGGTVRARRGRPPGRGVAAAGARAAGRRGDRRRAGARLDQRAAAALPAGGVPVARVPVGARARRHPGRRHGARQDPADAGADPARERRGAARGGRDTFGTLLSSSWRRPRCWRTGRPRRTGSPPT